MAKFKLRPELIAPLIAAGFINPSTGLMTYRVPYKTNRITGETMYELKFDPAKVIHTDNAYAANVIRGRKSPNIKVGGAWLIDDGTVPWFEELPDSDTTAIQVPAIDGIEILTKRERRLLKYYMKHSRKDVPNKHDKATMAIYVKAAKRYFADLQGREER